MVFKRHASRNIFCSIRIERSLGSVDKGKFMGINEKNGEIYGLTNKAREALQGKKFWRDQLDEVRQEIQWEEFGILRKAANDRTLEKIGRDTNREMEKYYRRYPQIRSSKAERQAEGIRGQFDHIRGIRF